MSSLLSEEEIRKMVAARKKKMGGSRTGTSSKPPKANEVEPEIQADEQIGDSESTRVSPPRKRTRESGKAPTANEETVMSRKTKKVLDLHSLPFVIPEFTEDSDSPSLLSSQFPYENFIDQNLILPNGKNWYSKAGAYGLARCCQYYGLKMAAMSRVFEKDLFNSDSKTKAIKDDLEQLKRTKVQEIEHLTKRVADLSGLPDKIANLESEKKTLENDKKKAEDELTTLQASYEFLQKEKEDWNKEVTELKTSIVKIKETAVDQYCIGFDKALKQAQTLYPDLDFSAMDASKVIKDGKLVSDEENEDDEGTEVESPPEAL